MLRKLRDVLFCGFTSVKEDIEPISSEKFEPPAPQISELPASPTKQEAFDSVLSSEHLIAACNFANNSYPARGTDWSAFLFTCSEYERQSKSTWQFIAFPGTCNTSDIALDTDVSLVELNKAVPFKDLTDKDGKVHKGFLGRYSGIAASDDFKSALRAVKASKPGSIVFTGHSLGGAIAMLAALDFKLRQPTGDKTKVFCITFGAPLLGDASVLQFVKDRDWVHDFLNVVSRHDLVPRILIARLTGLGIVLRSAFSKASQEALLALEEASGKAIAKKMEGLPKEAAESWQKLWDKVRVVCKNLRKIAGNIIIGLADEELSNYRPFGEFVVFTSTGFARFEDQVEVLQMLARTLSRSTCPVTTSSDALLEHTMASYLRAVRRINLEEPRWHRVKAWVADTKTLYELGMLAAQKDLLSMVDVVERELGDVATDVKQLRTLNADMLSEIRSWGQRYREGHPDDSAPVPNVRSLGGQSLDDAQKLRDNESRLAEKETKLAGVEAELRDFLAKKDNWRIYRLAGQQETLETLTEPEKAVAERINKCREKLRNFWDKVIKNYTDGLLPSDFFSTKERWLQLADEHRKLVEPLDITHYYRRKLYRHHADGKAHYLESDNRPNRYVLIEKLWVEGHAPGYPFQDSTQLAVDEAQAVERAKAAANGAG